MIGAFDSMIAFTGNQDKVQPAFKHGGGVAWGDQSTCLFCAVARFFRPGYQNHLVSEWLPALEGVVAKLERGACVADVGCGHGISTMLMAKAFPEFRVHWLRLPSKLDRGREGARSRGRRLQQY